jgi:hypothetical protein
MIESALLKLGDQKRQAIKEFLSDLLRHDDDKIADVWRSAGSDFFFASHDELASFLRLIQARV